jgi:hypothetical protein
MEHHLLPPSTAQGGPPDALTQMPYPVWNQPMPSPNQMLPNIQGGRQITAPALNQTPIHPPVALNDYGVPQRECEPGCPAVREARDKFIFVRNTIGPTRYYMRRARVAKATSRRPRATLPMIQRQDQKTSNDADFVPMDPLLERNDSQSPPDSDNTGGTSSNDDGPASNDYELPRLESVEFEELMRTI